VYFGYVQNKQTSYIPVSRSEMCLMPRSRNVRGVQEQKANKKTTITFAIDDRTLNVIREDADHQKISVNAKINDILLRYSLCYRYTEAGGGVIFPPRLVDVCMECIDHERLVTEYKDMVNDIVPSLMLANKLPLNFANWLHYAFDGILLFGGSYRGFSCFEEDGDGGQINLVFRHDYGLTWSKVIAEVYRDFLEKKLSLHVNSCTILPSSVTIKLLERNLL
jgi:hypothetical protein